MKKIVFTLAITLATQLAIAQAPTGYYNNATGKGYELKSQLAEIISKDYDGKNYDALKGLYRKESPKNGFKDMYYEKDNTILDIYSENATGQDPYNYTPGQKECGNYKYEGDCYNREHLIPQSVFSKKSPMVSDAFHIWPTDGKVNGQRSNYPLGVVGKETWTSMNGSKLGSALNAGYSEGFSGTVFEPIDEFKGDVARAYFYFVTRYENSGIQSWNFAMFDGTKNKVLNNTFLKILLTWHQNDPVSQRELDINDLVYEHQNNRNPFIDHPEYAQQIWNVALGTDDFEFQERTDVEVYTSNRMATVQLKNTSKNIESIHVFNLNGQVVNTIINKNNQQKVDVSIQTPGVYILKIVGKGMEINKRIVIK